MDSDRDAAALRRQTRDPDLGKVVLYQLSYSRIVLVTGAIV